MLRGLIKTGAAYALRWTGTSRLTASLSGKGHAPLILGYHRVVEDVRAHLPTSIPAMLISRSMLERHLDWIGRRYRFVSLDEIGAANTNGHLYVLDANNNLATRWHYDGSSPINTTPAPDSSGTWYFGADDGFVYDVEPPASGAVMFMAARFGPGGQVHASPSVAGCLSLASARYSIGSSARAECPRAAPAGPSPAGGRRDGRGSPGPCPTSNCPGIHRRKP